MTKKTFDELHRLEKGETEHLMAFFLLSGGSHNKNFILSFWPKMKNGWQKRSISQLKGQSLKITSVNQTVVKAPLIPNFLCTGPVISSWAMVDSKKWLSTL